MLPFASRTASAIEHPRWTGSGRAASSGKEGNCIRSAPSSLSRRNRKRTALSACTLRAEHVRVTIVSPYEAHFAVVRADDLLLRPFSTLKLMKRRSAHLPSSCVREQTACRHCSAAVLCPPSPFLCCCPRSVAARRPPASLEVPLDGDGGADERGREAVAIGTTRRSRLYEKQADEGGRGFSSKRRRRSRRRGSCVASCDPAAQTD